MKNIVNPNTHRYRRQNRWREEEKCREQEEKICEEFEAQAFVFCESVESQRSVKGETSL